MTNQIKALQLKNSKSLLTIYKKRLEQIKKSIIELSVSGGNTLKLSLEKKRLENIIKSLEKEFKEFSDDAIETAYKESRKDQNKRFNTLGLAVIGLASVNQETVKNEYYSHLTNITKSINQKIKNFVRADFNSPSGTIKALNYLISSSGIKPLNNIAESGLLSSEIEPQRWKDLKSRLEKQLKNKEIFTIPYYNKKGNVVRNVKASTYAEMLSRTLTANTYRDAAKKSILNQFGEFGDLVEILGRSVYPDSPCIPYQGQILSLTGQTKGYTTIDEAKGNGLFHPNCIHSFAVTNNVVDEYIKNNENKKGQEAINYMLLKQQGKIKAAFSRKDIGDIDLIWGDEKHGLKHIIERRKEQNIDINMFLADLANVIENGKLVRINSKGRYEIFLNNKMAIIEPKKVNGNKTFLLTAFKRRKA